MPTDAPNLAALRTVGDLRTAFAYSHQDDALQATLNGRPARLAAQRDPTTNAVTLVVLPSTASDN